MSNGSGQGPYPIYAVVTDSNTGKGVDSGVSVIGWTILYTPAELGVNGLYIIRALASSFSSIPPYKIYCEASGYNNTFVSWNDQQLVSFSMTPTISDGCAAGATSDRCLC